MNLHGGPTSGPVTPGRDQVLPLATLAVVGSYLGVASGAADRLDARLTSLATRPRAASVDRAMGVATDLGSVHALAGAVLSLTVLGRRRHALRLAASGAVAWGLAQGAKPALDRPRPFEQGRAERLVARPAGSSWPSGHAALVTASVAALGLARGGRGARAAGVAAVAGVACSRVVIGVHHASDVVAGIGVGAIADRVARLALDRVSRR